MRLEFKGVVTTGDSCRCDETAEQMGYIYIGGTDICDEVNEQKWSGDVRVTLNGEELANGTCVTQVGWGYSEYTPIENDTVIVGSCDLLERLHDLNGQDVHVVIEDVIHG